MELAIAGGVAGAIARTVDGRPCTVAIAIAPRRGRYTSFSSGLQSCVLERRHDLAREQIDGAQHLAQREVAEGELRHEVVGAGLLHL